MAKRRSGTIRIGPVSIFSLVIVLCLSVLAVLAVTTAQAGVRTAQRQAAFTTDTYRNEQLAQNYLAQLSDTLAKKKKDGEPIKKRTVSETFNAGSGRTLSIKVRVHADGTFEILEWKATTQWNDQDGNDALWSGSTDRA